MAGKFSFEADAQSKIISTYQQALEEIATHTNTFIDKITEIAGKANYLPIVNLGKRCILFYNEDVKENVERLFQEWSEGEASLKAFIEKMEGGDDALNTASSLQQNLEDAIPDMFNVKDESEFDAIDTSEPNPKEQDFDELKDATTHYRDQIEQAKDATLSTIDNEQLDNSAYACISSPVMAIFTVVVSAFEGISQQFDTVKEEYTMKEREFSETVEELKTLTESQAQTAAEDALANISVDFHL